MKVLINALHTHTGGGVTYLQNIVPYMAVDKRLALTVLAPAETLAKVALPKGVAVWKAPAYGFVGTHLWEQLVLPWLAWRRGFAAMLCNANFVPLLARRPMPILHTTAAAQEVTRGQVSWVYWLILRTLTMVGMVRAPVVFSLTNLMVQEFTPWPLTWVRGKAVVVPPGVPEARAGKVVKKAGFVMAVGDYYAQKDYPTLLRAFALVRSQQPWVQLEIVGKPVFPAVARAMEEIIAAENLGDCVVLVGALPHAKLMKRMAEAELFVTASVVESFNIPMLEAMAVGTPVVAVGAPYVVDVAGENVVVVPVAKEGNNVAALAMAMVGVLASPTLQAMFVRRGKAHVEGLTWAASGRRLAQEVAGVVGLGD